VPKVKKKKVRKKVKKRAKKRAKPQAGDKPLRNTKGQLLPGQCGNPKGRPKGSGHKYTATNLQEAIQAVEGQKGKTFLRAWIEAAWGDAAAMALVANFMMPKLRAIEQITFPGDSMDDEEMKEIRGEMLRRFGLGKDNKDKK